VVETSLHSLSVRYGGSGKRSARRGPVYHFFQRSHAKSSKRQRSLHTLARHLMAQLPSLQEPCAVKVAREEGFQYEFD
jgi:hypothetical protein